MKIQTKITLLLFVMTAMFLVAILFVNRYEKQREELLVKRDIYEKNTLYDKIERLEEASLLMFAYDFSNSDEMVDFVTSPGGIDKTESINQVLKSFNITGLFIYNTDFELLYSTGTLDTTGTGTISTHPDFFTTLFSRSYFCHFFISTPRGPVEIYSAPIQPAADNERKTAPLGFLFAARLWSPEYIMNIAQLTESTIRVFPIRGTSLFESTYDQVNGIIRFSRVKYDWDSKPLLQIYIENETPLTSRLHQTSRKLIMLFIIFLSAVIIMLSAFLIVWVNVPLKKISRSLSTEDAGFIEKLQKSKTEFGNLAQLICRFFRQKNDLTREVNDRLKAEKALREALRESRRSESETAALLQASRAVLEFHEFQDSSRAIIRSCKELSGATDGFIARIVRNGPHTYILLDPDTTMPLTDIYEQATRTGNPVYRNGYTSPRLPEGHSGIDNILCAPLNIKGTAVALLTLANKPGGFTDNDIRMAAAFSEITSVALLNSTTLESLENSEERFRSVVQTAGDAIISVNSRGNIVFWNRSAENIFGYTHDEVAGKPAAMLFPESSAEAFREKALQISTGRAASHPFSNPVEITGLRKDGTQFPMELSQSIWQTREGTFFTAIARDVTERKSAEERLRKSEKRFRDTIDNALTGRFIVRDGRIVYKNKEQARLFGNIPESFNFYELANVHPDDVAKVRRFYEDILSRKAVTRDVNYRFYPAGKMHSAADMRWVTCRAMLIEYQGREALFVNMMDISKFMELEQLVRIDDKMASLGRIAAGIAHEIRNPLTGINSYIYALRDTVAGVVMEPREHDALQNCLKQLLSASTKIESVIRRVMDFSKPALPRRALIDINKPVEEALELSSVTLRKNGIAIHKDLAENLPACYADFHMTEQVLLNLINNAVQALEGAAGDKHIQISTRLNHDSVIITVSDSGPGIPAENKHKVFDPFYTTRDDGSGIGLSICHRIITDHGGSMTVDTGTWGGAEFTIRLPVTEKGDRVGTAVSPDASSA